MSDLTTLAGLTATQRILLVEGLAAGTPACGCADHDGADEAPEASVSWKDLAHAPSDLEALVSFGLAIRHGDGGGALTHRGVRLARLAKAGGQ
jgi:hypothetical protein